MKEKFLDKNNINSYLLLISEIIANTIPVAVIWSFYNDNYLYSISFTMYLIILIGSIIYKIISFRSFLLNLVEKNEHIEKIGCLNLALIYISMMNII